MVKVKICGITNVEDALAAVDAGADLLGFVVAEEGKTRKRYVSLDGARAIIEALPQTVETVAVCVNDDEATLRGYLEVVDYVQLHGEESPALCARIGRRAIKAFRVGPGFDVQAMTAYPAQAYLLDAYVPGARGGTGQACDWAVACAAVALGKRIMLAGGLTPENVAEAVAHVRPYAVDTSGGVEAAPGKKDHERVRRFIQNAKLPVS
jgi:phosphoribosylanthranilate isomerase